VRILESKLLVTSFGDMTTQREASAAIDRLERVHSSRAQRTNVRIERPDVVPDLTERPSDATRVRGDEITGCGANCRWSHLVHDE
jgi:hypothetical protein